MTGYAVKVFGAPAPKGSMKCIGKRGKVMHSLVEDSKRTKPWRDLVATAGRLLEIHPPLAGAVAVHVTFTVDLPDSVKPAARPWPFKRSSGVGGDVDKLARTVLDGLQDAGVFADDSQVCELVAVKAHPHTDAADVLDQQGAFIRIFQL